MHAYNTYTTGPPDSNHPKMFHCKRLYMALILNELVNERPLQVVSEEWGIDRGTLQRIQLDSAAFAGMVLR